MLFHQESSSKNKDYRFKLPEKNNKGIYVSKIQDKLQFKLPQMDILNIINDNQLTFINYLIDLEDINCNKLIRFLYKLDNIAIKAAESNSLNWFGTHHNKDKIQKKYIPIYDTDKHDNLYIKIRCDPIKLKEIDIHKPHYSIICIEGLEFYKKKFTFSLSISKIIKLRESKINNEVIDNLADYEDSNSSIEDESDIVNTKLSKIEIESIIDKKKQELDKCFKDAELASRSAENLRLMAIQKANELKNIESMLIN